MTPPKPNPTILAFDTSAAHCAAALLSNDEVMIRVEEMARGQGERLMGLLEEVLADAGLAWSDLDGIGVGVGPGNFTGIRIAVSAARGLALGLGKPAIGVSAFEAAAYGFKNVIACIPAPRDQAYVQAHVSGADQDPKLIDLRDLKAFPSVPSKADARFIGPAAQAVAEAHFGQSVSDFDIAQQPVMPIEAIARIAASRLQSVKTRPAPLYVRPADAAPPREKPPVILP